jgi:hypothetical protein
MSPRDDSSSFSTCPLLHGYRDLTIWRDAAMIYASIWLFPGEGEGKRERAINCTVDCIKQQPTAPWLLLQKQSS